MRRAILLIGLIIFLGGWFFNAEAWARSLYVSDSTLEAMVRSGPDIDHTIIASLPVGTQVTMINVENGWAEVSLPDGRTGWTLARYLSNRPPWRFTAEKLAKERDLLESHIREVETRTGELREENDRLEKELASLQEELESTSDRYQALQVGSKNYLGLQRAHEKLSAELPEIREKLKQAQLAHNKLQSSVKIRWFLYGAGVMLLGWILGLIMGGRRWRRSSEVYR